jgi:Tol biopolymer transport system component
MHPFPALLGVAVLALADPIRGGADVPAASSSRANASESAYLSRTRQLTLEGRRAGEGYWSPDDRSLVFQSERVEGNPFYQIFTMDLETGDTRRISPGVGKTTCAFFHPDGKRILYASTHLDPESVALQDAELEMRASGKERRYSWDYDEHFDLFVHDLATGEDTRLTDARGYDAEGSYSPDGKWIAFTSMRHAYTDELTAEEAEQLELNPSYFGEIWIQPADGSGEARRLTDVPGYDGGPFFTPDGERIVWRRFDTEGVVADIYTMALDGSDVRRLTDFGCMSWAPYFHPSGEYVLFACNKQGFANFEIYAVDAAGEKEPVRITTTDRFDGLPVPSHAGDRIAFTSSRKGGEGAQLFLSQWNHEAVRAALEHAPGRTNHSLAAEAP